MNRPTHQITVVAFFFFTICAQVAADVIVDTTPSGTADRSSASDFIGILDNVSPTQIGLNVNFNGTIPAGENFLLGDLVGRDINATSGDRTWEYQLILPSDAVSGTGFTNIQFNGHAFENANNNLENNDQILWELFLNNDTTPVQTGGPAAGSDWTTFDVNLAHPGGASITSVRVVFTVTGFNAGGEWFATRGSLQAEYQAIPEPIGSVFVLAACFCSLRRRRILSVSGC